MNDHAINDCSQYSTVQDRRIQSVHRRKFMLKRSHRWSLQRGSCHVIGLMRTRAPHAATTDAVVRCGHGHCAAIVNLPEGSRAQVILMATAAATRRCRPLWWLQVQQLCMVCLHLHMMSGSMLCTGGKKCVIMLPEFKLFGIRPEALKGRKNLISLGLCKADTKLQCEQNG